MDEWRRQMQARGAATSGRGRQGTGEDDVQVDGVPGRERRRVAGVTERCYGDKQLLMGGGSMEEGTENDPETVDTGGAGGARIRVKH